VIQKFVKIGPPWFANTHMRKKKKKLQKDLYESSQKYYLD
jgi:hypothetical protein